MAVLLNKGMEAEEVNDVKRFILGRMQNLAQEGLDKAEWRGVGAMNYFLGLFQYGLLHFGHQVGSTALRGGHSWRHLRQV